MQHYFICTIHFYAILNKSKNATLQYFIFCEKELDKKYLLKCFPDMKQAICRNSTNLSLLMSKLFKALFTGFCNYTCAKRLLCLSEFVWHTCVALIHKKTVLSLKTSAEVNFEFIKFVKSL